MVLVVSHFGEYFSGSDALFNLSDHRVIGHARMDVLFAERLGSPSEEGHAMTFLFK